MSPINTQRLCATGSREGCENKTGFRAGQTPPSGLQAAVGASSPSEAQPWSPAAQPRTAAAPLPQTAPRPCPRGRRGSSLRLRGLCVEGPSAAQHQRPVPLGSELCTRTCCLEQGHLAAYMSLSPLDGNFFSRVKYLSGKRSHPAPLPAAESHWALRFLLGFYRHHTLAPSRLSLPPPPRRHTAR